MIIANSQTGGKGRLGRTFFSPLDSGVYISILLRPSDMEPQKALRITTMAAVAASDAVEEVSGKTAPIKWVNDIFVGGLKVAGILTEASVSMENGSLEYAVLGIGFNVYEPEGGFPEELKKIAGAIFDRHEPDAKNRLTAAFLNNFNVITPVSSRRAKVLDITDDCALKVEYEDKTTDIISTGEVSIRP